MCGLGIGKKAGTKKESIEVNLLKIQLNAMSNRKCK